LYGLEEAQNTPVLALVENTMFKLVVTKPACLLLPKTWAKHRSTLHNFALRRCQLVVTGAIADLDARNTELCQPSGVLGSKLNDHVGQIYHLLDSVDYNTSVRIDDLAFDCMEIESDAGRLISAVMQWASSIYRQGSHHIYLATRLLRKWSHLGADVYSGLLGYLTTMVSNERKEPAVVFRIIAELLRSRTFSLGRFLQWLIATGSLTHHTDLSSVSCSVYPTLLWRLG
jgi:mediator of RNA polymerase II transcription subunit 12